MIEFLLDYLPIIIVAIILTFLWFVLRTRSSRFVSVAELDQCLGSGQPVVLKFFKNT